MRIYRATISSLGARAGIRSIPICRCFAGSATGRSRINNVGVIDMRKGKFVKLDCYIQEYRSRPGSQLNARLVEKSTDKKVVIFTHDPGLKHQFLVFLSQAKINKPIMPTVFDKDGTDIVTVRGMCVDEDGKSISVNPHVETGGFLFAQLL